MTNLFTVFYLSFILPATNLIHLTLAGTEDEDIKYDKSKSF